MANVIGYIRVSTEEQAQSGAGLAAQRAAILEEAQRRGWNLVEIIEDAGYSAKDLKRPGILAALAALDRKTAKADTLVVAKVDRLSRSLLDFAGIMDRATREHFAVVALDLGMDSATPSGRMMANILAVFAAFERDLISQRTKDALAQKAAAGVRLGRRVEMSEEIRARIVAERAAGASVSSIAYRLTAEGVPTTQPIRKGRSTAGRWYPSTVRAALDSIERGTPRKEVEPDTT
jgi:DNA invertase Pin-like site-specific DNA recombinase